MRHKLRAMTEPTHSGDSALTFRIDMKPLFCYALAAALGLPMAVQAAGPASAPATAASPQPQDAQAATPPLAYRSAFDAYQPAPEEDATPDETWRDVNRKVGDAGGHMGHMDHMQHTGKMNGHAMPMAMPAATPAPSAPAPAHHHGEH